MSLILFVVFIDRVLRCFKIQTDDCIHFGSLQIASLLLAVDVVLLALSEYDLHCSRGQFAAECKAAGMRISTSTSEAMVLSEGSELKQ